MILKIVRHFLIPIGLLAPFVVQAQPLNKVVALINGVAVVEADLNQEMQKIMPLNKAFHGSGSSEKLERVRKEAMQTLVVQELQRQDAKAKGMKLSNSELKREIGLLAERNTSGTDFKQVIAGAGFDEASFERFVERNVLAARIQKAEIDDKVKVTDQQVKEFYTNNLKRYSKPREFRASHILIKVEPSASKEDRDTRKAKAEELLKKIRGGGDFAAIAYDESDDLTRIKGGDVGYFHAGQALPEFDGILEQLKVGESSAVLETIYGYHIIKLTDSRPARQIPFEEISGKIKNDLIEAEKKSLRESWMSGLTKKAVISYPAEK